MVLTFTLPNVYFFYISYLSIFELWVLCAYTHPNNHFISPCFSSFLFISMLIIAQAPFNSLSILPYIIKPRSLEIVALWIFNLLILEAGTAVQWLGSLSLSYSLCGVLHVLPMSTWVSSGFSDFFPRSKTLQSNHWCSPASCPVFLD